MQGEEMAIKILVADDEVHIARILQLTLDWAGYAADLAFDGREALELLRKKRPFLVILDLTLPVLDGHEVRASRPICSWRNLSIRRFSSKRYPGFSERLDEERVFLCVPISCFAFTIA
jgi:chemotaxis response regulator CheB